VAAGQRTGLRSRSAKSFHGLPDDRLTRSPAVEALGLVLPRSSIAHHSCGAIIRQIFRRDNRGVRNVAVAHITDEPDEIVRAHCWHASILLNFNRSCRACGTSSYAWRKSRAATYRTAYVFGGEDVHPIDVPVHDLYRIWCHFRPSRATSGARAAHNRQDTIIFS
jgi:hypothetical protein